MIDSHIHIINADERYNGVFSFSVENLKVRLKKLDSAVVFGFITQYENSMAANAALVDALKIIPRNKYIYFSFLHPRDINEEFIKTHKPDGIKIHPSISQCRISDMTEQLELIECFELPVLVHCGRGEISRLHYLLEINEKYPKINFIAAHLGGLATELILQALELLKEKKPDNVWLDTSGCCHPALIKQAVSVMGNDKVIFGTDTPFFDFEISKHVIKQCKFDPHTTQNIFHDNILRVLKRI